MKKIVVKDCEGCPFRLFVWGRDYNCKLNEYKHCPDPDSIPEWCPLEDN